VADRGVGLRCANPTYTAETIWQKLSLKEAGVTLIDCDHRTPPAADTGYPYIAIPQIKNGHIQLDGVRRISPEDFADWTRKLKPQENDVIVVRRCSSGDSAVVPRALECAIGQNLVVLRSDGKRVLPEFLRWLVSGPDWWEQVGKFINVGAVFDSLKCREIPHFELTIPPIEAQHEIAALLGALDDRITLLRETNATLEAIAQALFKSWFVDFDPVHAKQQGIAPEGMDDATAALFPDSFEESELGLVPRGWRVSRLADEVERITKGTTPTTIKRPFVACGINFVKAESMTDDGQFIPEKFAYIDDETHELLKRSQLKAGDVLISIAGTIGRLAVMTEEFLPANTNQAVALIRPFQDRFPSGLISRFLQRTESQQLMGERVVQAVQANLSLGSLSDMKVVVAPAEVINKLYSAGLAQIDASKVMNASRIRTLATLRDTLLPRLITGKLRLPEVAAQL
jgi:type I restriction enzyme S subunit